MSATTRAVDVPCANCGTRKPDDRFRVDDERANLCLSCAPAEAVLRTVMDLLGHLDHVLDECVGKPDVGRFQRVHVVTARASVQWARFELSHALPQEMPA